MKKFTVEMLVEGTWDNIIGDYIETETETEALELAKQWVIDNGGTEEYEMRAKEYQA